MNSTAECWSEKPVDTVQFRDEPPDSGSGLAGLRRVPRAHEIGSSNLPSPTKVDVNVDSEEETMTDMTYNVIKPDNGVPIKAWTRGVPLEDAARQQLLNVAQLPFIYKWVAAMPDVHWGIGATVGSVIPTRRAIIPAAVGVDIGCGMMAVRTSLHANQLPDNLHGIRAAIEKAVPHGRTDNGGKNDRGAWSDAPAHHLEVWAKMEPAFKAVVDKYPKLNHVQRINHLGTLGTGNHFIEVCLDENENLWFLLHSGSRGVGNRFGTFFIELAKNDMRQWMINLPDQDLAYLPQGTEHFDDYVRAVHWAQDYALTNRELMMQNMIAAVQGSGEVPAFEANVEVVSCHHNYVTWEHHYGENVLITRKGAVRAREGDMGIIPGQHGSAFVHRAGQGQSGELHELQPWSRSCHVAWRGQAPFHGRGPHEGNCRCGVP